jgi:hypothetical protein
MPTWQKIDEIRIEVFVLSGPTAHGVQAALADPLLLTRLRTAVRRALFPKPAHKAVRVTVRR